MEDMRLTAAELTRRCRLLERLAHSTKDPDEDHRCMFALDTASGRQIYRSFSDEALLSVLRQTADELGRSPAQKEVFWAYRAYLRERFGKWPYALERAGLSKSAGVGGARPEQVEAKRQALDALLEQVRQTTRQLGRTPHPKDLPQVCAQLRRHYKTWGQVLQAAGVAQVREENLHFIENLEPEYRNMLEEIRALSERLGRAPQRREVGEETRTALAERCGSWRNALHQIGLEPVQRIAPFSDSYLTQPDGSARAHRGTLHDCYYRVLHPDEQTQAALLTLQAHAARLGHVPDRKEVPPEIRRHLQDTCGSWPNALFQVGLHCTSFKL